MLKWLSFLGPENGNPRKKCDVKNGTAKYGRH
jgi:hypothetical protein